MLVVFGATDAIAFVFLNAVLLYGNQPGPEIPAIPAYKSRIACLDKELKPQKGNRGDYHVHYNYVLMNKTMECWESVTFATEADFIYLVNLERLVERWNAPISLALNAPGDDFQRTVDSIKHLRNCGNPLIRKFVTFHLYYHKDHAPKNIPTTDEILHGSYDCKQTPPWLRFSETETYREQKKLGHPAMMGLNIARKNSPTHYMLVADIEMYPSLNLVNDFLEMIARDDQAPLFRPFPRIFALAPYQVADDSELPANKSQLLNMIAAKQIGRYGYSDESITRYSVPEASYWEKVQQSDALRVASNAKRIGPWGKFIPIYIGTSQEPDYNERELNSEQAKALQGKELCTKNYDILVLNRAFVVYRRGVKPTNGRRRRSIGSWFAGIASYIVPSFLRPKSFDKNPATKTKIIDVQPKKVECEV